MWFLPLWMSLMVALFQNAGRRKRPAADRELGQVNTSARLSGICEPELYGHAVNAVQAPDAGADKGVEACAGLALAEARVVGAGGGVRPRQVEPVLAPVDLEVVGQAEVAVELEAVGDPRAVRGEDAAAARHPA